LPVYNAANPGAPITGLGEVYVTGVRNGYRVSFDRANSDMYWGDVGENAVEEVGFLKAGTNTGATPPVDFGWPQLEATTNSNIAGAPHTSTNPFTGGSSTLPIQQFSHSAGLAVIGGYVYRGPVAELQGKYFYCDFAGLQGAGSLSTNGKLYMLDFDRNTPTTSFNGNNGTLTDVSVALNNLVVDTNDPSYLPSISQTDLAGLDHIVSFGEDNAGNVYLVDMGNRTIGTGTQSFFDGQYPHLGLGEIFRITPVGSFSSWNVDSSSDWALAGNWTAGAPNSVGDQAIFGSMITSPRTVSVNAPETVSTITFNSAVSYTIAGSSTLTLKGALWATLVVNSGTHTISTPLALESDLTLQTTASDAQLFLDSPINATGRTITKLGLGTAQMINLRASTVQASEGILKVSAKPSDNSPSGTSAVTSLTFGTSGKLDLTNNSLVIDYTGPVGALVGDTRTNLLNGKLISSTATTNRGLGYGDNSLLGFATFAGQTVDADSVLVKYTYFGDADLDGDVDVADLGNLASAWQSEGVWFNGDFDYNGSIDVNDLGLLASNWQAGMGDPLSPGSLNQVLASLGLPLASVPEPASVLLAVAGASLIVKRRRS
jgi:hypothetical protein